MPEKTYWICHCRGPNFRRLRERGFLTLYPDIDDYVFLEAVPANEGLLQKQTELGVFFLRAHNAYVKVSGEDIQQMLKRAGASKITVGTHILVVEGAGSNLEGTVTEVDEAGLKVRCDLIGFGRHYNIWTDVLDLVVQGDLGAERGEPENSTAVIFE